MAVKECFQRHDIWMRHATHDLQFSVLQAVACKKSKINPPDETFNTLNRLSCSTFFIATSSPVRKSLAWYTTPNEPLPATL